MPSADLIGGATQRPPEPPRRSLFPGRRIVVTLVVLAAVGLVGGYGVAMRSRPHAVSVALDATPSPTSTSNSGSVYVDVAGAVHRPGLYRMHQGERVDDAIRAAGGVLTDADIDALNLATRLRDGDKILVPHKGAGSGGTGGATAQGTLVNLNTATAADLDALPGIGPALAQRIVTYRDQHGGFRTVDELQKVPGIGPSKLSQLRDLVAV